MKNKQTTRRKLQFAGNSSYVLTLPKKWIISQNLDTNNSEVLIEELSDSTIRITPSENYKNKELNEIGLNEAIRASYAYYLSCATK